MRNTERGISHWPFIITLVLLLVFGFLWFSEKGDRESADKKLQEAGKLRDQYSAELAEAKGKLQEITDKVGWVEKKDPKDVWHTAGNSVVGPFTDVEAVSRAIDPNNVGGPVNAFREALKVQMRQDYWRPKAGQGAATKVDIEKLPQGFKDKVKEVQDAWPGEPPTPPTDPDDANATAAYNSAKEEYEGKVAKYRKLMDELVAMKDWPAYSETIGYFAPYELDRSQVVSWEFYYGFGSTPTTVEEWITKVPAVAAKNLKDAFVEHTNALLQQIDALKNDNAQKDLLIDNADEAKLGLKQQLEKEQQAHTADTTRLSNEAAAAKAETENQRVVATTEANKSAKLEQDQKIELAKRDQETSALKNRILTDKQKEDLRISRNDPDGTLLDANAILGVGYINLGSQDKVYAGLKFEVSAAGRGGIRVTKGEVVVTRVLDAHYSQVRILSQVTGERPLGKGDWIANPFYEKDRVIHLYLAGELRKYPRAIAVERLARMGVQVEDKINDKTDYVLIPDAMAVGVTPAPEGGAAPEAGKESEFDRLSKLANTFGATLITEKMIEAFLDY